MPQNAKRIIDVEPQRPRGRPKIEDLKELEARIVRVALQCFIAHGYGATSMNEVAKAARVSKKTLYARFPTKADLFRGVVDEQIDRVGGGIRLSGPKPKTLETLLRTYAEHILQRSLSPEILALNRLIGFEAARFPELGEAARARRRIGVLQVSEHIRDYALKEGVPCKDPEGAAEIFHTLLTGWYSDASLASRPVTTAEVRAWTRQMLKLFLAARSSW